MVFLVNIVTLSLSFVILACVPSYLTAPAAAAFILLGFSISGLGIAHTVRVLHASPAEHRGPYASVFFTVNGLVAGFASMVSGFLLDLFPSTIDIGPVALNPLRIYFPSVSLLILATLLYLKRLKPVAEPSFRQVLRDLAVSLPPGLSALFGSLR